MPQGHAGLEPAAPRASAHGATGSPLGGSVGVPRPGGSRIAAHPGPAGGELLDAADVQVAILCYKNKLLLKLRILSKQDFRNLKEQLAALVWRLGPLRLVRRAAASLPLR